MTMDENLYYSVAIYPSNWNYGGKTSSETILCVTPKEPTIVLSETDGDGW